MTPIRLENGLLFVTVKLASQNLEIELDRVLLDTGSGGTAFKTDLLRQIGIYPTLDARIRLLVGIGGEEAVIEKDVERITVGSLYLEHFMIQIGALDYGVPLDGILGLDFLLQTKAIIDLDTLTLRTRTI